MPTKVDTDLCIAEDVFSTLIDDEPPSMQPFEAPMPYRTKLDYPTEAIYQTEAWWHWFNGGSQPLTHKEVAELALVPAGVGGKTKPAHPSAGTIAQWSRRFRWAERRAEYLDYLSQSMAARANVPIERQLEPLIALVDLGIQELTKAIRAGEVKWTGADIKRLVEARMLLAGQPTQRVEQLSLQITEVMVHDPETVAVATALFERLRLGTGDAGGAGVLP